MKEGVSKMVCERWCGTKSCVEDGVCVTRLCEGWCVTKMMCERGCVKDGV